MEYLFDTNVCIYIIKKKPLEVFMFQQFKLIKAAEPQNICRKYTTYQTRCVAPKYFIMANTSSNEWIKKNRLTKFKFEWQKGYGAFSHSRTQLDTVVNYILSQEQHHKKKSFRLEYLEMLHKNDIEFKEEYVFDFIDDGNDWK